MLTKFLFARRCCEHGQGSVTLSNSDTGEVLFFNNSFSDRLEMYFHVDGLGNLLWNDTEYSTGPEEDEEQSIPESTNFFPADDTEWPGEYPETGSEFLLAINVRYDDYPGETSWKFEQKLSTPGSLLSTTGAADLNDDWALVIKRGFSADEREFTSDLVAVQANSVYRLVIEDNANKGEGDGTCCDYGRGWFSVTNGTASSDNLNGTVMWVLPGNDFQSLAQVYFLAQSDGTVEIVDSSHGTVLPLIGAPSKAAAPSAFNHNNMSSVIGMLGSPPASPFAPSP